MAPGRFITLRGVSFFSTGGGADLVQVRLEGTSRNRLFGFWMADITQVCAGAGWLCLAMVLDAWSRRIVGWAMDTRMPAGLVGDALAMAITSRQPVGPVIHHSDRGSQYTSLAFGRPCNRGNSIWPPPPFPMS